MTAPNELGANPPDGTEARVDGSAAVDRDDEDGAGTGGPAGGVTVYRWTCPICRESRTGMASGDEDPAGKAAFSLRQHVWTTEDDGHGGTNRYPPGFDPDAAGRATSIE